MILNPDELNARLVFDTVYNPIDTPLIRAAREKGIAVITGVEMFVQQGARQFEIWTGKPAPEEEMLRVVLHALRRRAEAATPVLEMGPRIVPPIAPRAVAPAPAVPSRAVSLPSSSSATSGVASGNHVQVKAPVTVQAVVKVPAKAGLASVPAGKVSTPSSSAPKACGDCTEESNYQSCSQGPRSSCRPEAAATWPRCSAQSCQRQSSACETCEESSGCVFRKSACENIRQVEWQRILAQGRRQGSPQWQ